jgi:hypothetical protein
MPDSKAVKIISRERLAASKAVMAAAPNEVSSRWAFAMHTSNI